MNFSPDRITAEPAFELHAGKYHSITVVVIAGVVFTKRKRKRIRVCSCFPLLVMNSKCILPFDYRCQFRFGIRLV